MLPLPLAPIRSAAADYFDYAPLPMPPCRHCFALFRHFSAMIALLPPPRLRHFAISPLADAAAIFTLMPLLMRML